MAIKLAEIHEEKLNPALTPKDKEALDSLEIYTDKVIREEYGNNPDFRIILDSATIDKILGRLPFIRVAVVQKAWIELFKASDWELRHSADESQPVSVTAGKKGKAKKAGKHDDIWIVSPLKK